MYCPKCSKENPDDARTYSDTNAELSDGSSTSGFNNEQSSSKSVNIRISKTAVAASICALFGLLCLVPGMISMLNPRVLYPKSYFIILLSDVSLLVIAVSFILGVIALAQIGASGGRLTGYAFAAIGAAVPFVQVFALGWLGTSRALRIKTLSPHLVCGSNLSKIGKAMLIYANDYNGQLPRASGRDTAWGGRIMWDATDRFPAFFLSPDGSGGYATISSSFYLLVKYSEVAPKLFICPDDSGATKFNLSDYPNRNPAVEELIDAWDFGPVPAKHCSYTYHMPYGLYALNTSCEPGMAVAADRNPWIISPAADAKDFSRFKPDIPPWNGTVKQAKY